MGYSFLQGEVPAWEWGARRALFFRSQGWRRTLPGWLTVATTTMQGQPKGPGWWWLCRDPGPERLDRDPCHPEPRAWSGAGPTMASASPGGQLDPPGRRAGRWRAGPLGASAQAAILRGQDAAAYLPWTALARMDRARRSLRARLLPRREGGASRNDGPLFAGHGQGLIAAGGQPAGGGRSARAPDPARTAKPRRWAPIGGPRPGYPPRESSSPPGVRAILAAPLASGGLEPATLHGLVM